MESWVRYRRHRIGRQLHGTQQADNTRQSEMINITQAKISDVKSNPNNPRTIKDEKFNKLVKSIQDFPEMLRIRPIVVNLDMVVLGGNMRLKACKEAGLKEIPIIRADQLTEDQQREFIIKDNVGFGEWEWDMIRADWDVNELAEWGLDIPEFETTELEAVEDDYEMPDQVETNIVIGDLFEIGEHRLLCGDSTDSDQVAKLMDGKKADLIFTSPPYNGNTQTPQGKLYLNNDLDNKTEEDYLNFLDEIKDSFYTILKSKGIICWNIMYNNNSRQSFIKNVNRFIDSGLLLNETIIWKKNAIPLSKGLSRAFEFIFIFQKDELDFSYQDKYSYNENVWEISNAKTQTEHHKACFPVELPSNGIKLFTKEDMILFEPFTGSGTTMVASHQLNRKCYGMELDPKYCQVIIDRMLKLDPSLTIKRNGKPYQVTGEKQVE
jgi:DNA modification methylase